MRKSALLAVAVVLVGAAVCIAGVPKGMAGFKGYLIGEIVSVDAEGLYFRVTGVVPIDGSKAENPKAVKGQKIRILFKHFMDKEGRYRADRELMDWIFKLLKEGGLVTLKVFADGEKALIVEKAWHGAHEHPEAEKEKEREKAQEPEHREKEREKESEEKSEGKLDKLPEDARGFSGMVRGVVVKKVDGGFLFKVAKILKVWKGNKAKNPESLIGKIIWVGPRWVKGEDGKWHPYELHVRFIKHVVVVNAEGNIEIINEEGERFHLLELSEEQRKRAREAGGEESGEKEREHEKEREREEHAEKEKEREEVAKKEGEGEKERDLPEKGVVVGEITLLKDAEFWLKVIEASKDCKKLQGEIMKFFAQWIKGRNGKWIPDPKEVQGFGQLRLGYIVKVEFYFDEHWRVKKIQIVRKSDRKRQNQLREKQHELEKKEEKENAEKEKREREKQKK